jgi:beta-lactamase superfamily II metal-dependent hydrolase
MSEICFFPLGNADTTRLITANGRRILFDYAPLVADDARFELEQELRNDLRRAGKKGFDVLCITHVDDDHCRCFEKVFYLRHSTAHQGGDRMVIDTLWVPAAAITETNLVNESARRVQKEARHRLIEGRGVVVFSAPKALDDWLWKQGIDPASRASCISHAGELVPGWSLASDAVEFFIHSPLSWRQDEQGMEVIRNSASVVLQAVMRVGGSDTRLLLGADVDSADLTEIVRSTRRHGNDDRLDWDILKLFHHCSYKSLNKDDRGVTETKPIPEVADLIEKHGAARSIIVSPSECIPANLSKDGDLPPHRQAANYYKRVQGGRDGLFKVTMETPTKPVIVTAGSNGASFKTALAAPAAATTISKPARAG